MTTSDWINAGLAFFTALMAGGTFYLAFLTRRLARESVRATEQADRHHQENSRPFCLIAFTDPSDTHPFGIEFDPNSRRLAALMSGSSITGTSSDIHIRGTLQNKGKGPAKDIYVYLNMRRGESDMCALRLTRPVLVSGLIGPENVEQIEVNITERDIMHEWDGAGWKPTQVFSMIATDVYEVVLEYKDVFGNIFRTVHPRGIWTNPVPDVSTREKREAMMIRPNRPTPVFLEGRQAVRTPADLPPPPQVSQPDNSQDQIDLL